MSIFSTHQKRVYRSTAFASVQASSNFTSDDTGEHGFKRSLKWFRRWLDEHGHDSAVSWGETSYVSLDYNIRINPQRWC